MTRWMLHLECGDKVVSDDVPVTGDNEFCPGCGASFPIVDFYVHHDDEIDG